VLAIGKVLIKHLMIKSADIQIYTLCAYINTSTFIKVKWAGRIVHVGEQCPIKTRLQTARPLGRITKLKAELWWEDGVVSDV
jgi:hypothetical protein